MRIYPAGSEETLRARKLLKDWRGEDLITEEQYKHLEQETVSELRTTNIFLRLVLFFFTVVGVAAVAGLLFMTALRGASEPATGIFLMMFAAGCYAGAEIAASHFKLYRHGVEEALAAGSVAFLCAGMLLVRFPPPLDNFLLPSAGAVLSLWIWQRFGLWYAFPAAMIFAVFVPDGWIFSLWAQHVIIVLIYGIGVVCVIAARSRRRVPYFEDEYAPAEAFLWLGIYLALNLQLSVLTFRARYFIGDIRPASEFPGWFYWTTWVVIWCLPVVVLWRGIRRRDRLVMAVGGIAAVVTFATNKPYLGWTRHTWDPMILGVMLTAAALWIRRWLENGPKGVRGGFTAERLSAKDKELMNLTSSVLGLVSAPSAPAPKEEFRFGGGASGGAGAGGQF